MGDTKVTTDEPSARANYCAKIDAMLL